MFNNAARSTLNGHPLSDADLYAVAPSIFATGKHESRSERYAYIPTSAIVTGLRDAGFEPTWATQGRSRVAGKAEYTKHLVRFRPAGQEVAQRKLGGLYPEVALLNSHDGTTKYKLMAGVMRLVCLNGMLVADHELGSISVPHRGDVHDVIEGTYTVIEESRRAIGMAEHWADIRLDRDEEMALAESARVLRFGDAEGEVHTAIQAEQLLRPRRVEDHGNDLWAVTSRLQENVIRGGMGAYGTNANLQRRWQSAREIRGIDDNVRLNKALWLLSERMAELKA